MATKTLVDIYPEDKNLCFECSSYNNTKITTFKTIQIVILLHTPSEHSLLPAALLSFLIHFLSFVSSNYSRNLFSLKPE